ncbi:hypothetical protein N7G274_006489 [Stereocaulon virgatum]|uniref:Uncharacterized protein n=1 Tax=Stereocaulon virgatum TaxID=373712 RepID=A0ABR4A502_9LECA
MANEHEMSVHANEYRRCDRRDPQMEGISRDKLDLIESSWGASWEKMFEIIFPGAPVPSPFFEAQDQSIQNTSPSFPASGELGDFEVYNRTALPLLVEAHLHAIVSTEMAPVEESLRIMLVDIVRRCQATVAQNFQIMKALRPNSSSATETSPPATQARSMSWTAPENRQPHMLGMTSPLSSSNQEPPHLRDEANLTIPRPPNEAQNQRTTGTLPLDSAYASVDGTCECICHVDSFSSEASSNLRACEICVGQHTDPANIKIDYLDDLFEF